MSKSFKMDFTYVPVKNHPIISLHGNVVCSVGQVSLFIAPPGTGKSSICEALAAGGINPECDALGFKIDSKNTLYVDTERVLNDLSKGLWNIKNRSGADKEEILNRFDMRSMIFVDTVEICKSELTHLTSTKDFDLVIIDGCADFVTTVNDEQESKSFWRWLISLANKNTFGVVVTIHPNPADKEGKATGHLGSQGQKKAESVFNVFKSTDDKEIRLITTDSMHGKVRNAMDSLTTSFTWSKEESMFVSCDQPVRAGKIGKDIREIFKHIFREIKFFSYKDLTFAYTGDTNKSISTAKRDIRNACDLGVIVVHQGFYWLNGTEEEPTMEIEGEEQNIEQEEELPF